MAETFKSWLLRYRIGFIFLAALLFRLALIPTAAHLDVLTQADWGTWMSQHGLNGLYAANVWRYEWPNQAPLSSLMYGGSYFIRDQLMFLFNNFGNFVAFHHLGAGHLLWYFNFVKWYGSQTFETTGVSWGIIATIKFFAVAADLVIAGILYVVARKQNVQKPILFSVLYLFLPFSWYLSAVWGQSDQIVFLFLILSFLSILRKKWTIFSPSLIVCACLVKPTAFLFIPLFLFAYWLTYRPAVKDIIVGWLLAFGLLFGSLYLFHHPGTVNFGLYDLPHRVLFTKFPFTVVSALNFWAIFYQKGTVGETVKILGVSAKLWGYMLFAVCNLFACNLVRKRNPSALFAAMFVVGFGGWLFLTNMYERYVFAGFMSLLLLAIYQTKFLKYWITLSVVYWLNLYDGWWFPTQLEFLHQLMTWQSGVLLRVISAFTTVFFLIIVYKIHKQNNQQLDS